MSNAAKTLDAVPSTAGHKRVTGLSGNEIFCLHRLGMQPGNLCIGNSVFSLGMTRSIRSGLKTLAGGEITDITNLIHEGRAKALERMMNEAKEHGGKGITGVSTELVRHASNVEFLSIGSTVHHDATAPEAIGFSTSSSAQELYCQVDAGFQPRQFVFGNVAYSIGLGGNFGGALSSLSRGEVMQYTEVFHHTRHLALARLTAEAKRSGANSVVGINTTITPFMGAQEMLMIGTASHHPSLANFAENPVTSDMTNEEMWNMVNIGYLPLRLVMGVSVYSLGLVGGIFAALQSLGRGEVNGLTSLLYEAREKALDRIQYDAQKWGADEIVGVKTHVYDLGGGLIEFLAIGTAVKKIDNLTTKTGQLIPQAVMRDRDTFFEGEGSLGLDVRTTASASAAQRGPITIIFSTLAVLLYLISFFLRHK